MQLVHPRWLLLAALGGCTAASPDATVPALRFRQFLSNGAMDFSHGGGAWYDCLFLPDAGVVAQVIWERDPAQPLGPERPRMYVYRSTLEAARQPPYRGENAPAARRDPEPLRIPREFAARIVALADDTAELHARSLQLASECIASRTTGDRDSVGARDF